jgi:hypothetical protein
MKKNLKIKCSHNPYVLFGLSVAVTNLRKQLKGGKIYFGSQFQTLQSVMAGRM